ncbi:MAG TPA: hypothetical protein VM889_14185 [Candidatus Thermoplasmatota archaeon]|nr:hypothetical protein [Candidatus Thermoplasmatota archaeon]
MSRPFVAAGVAAFLAGLLLLALAEVEARAILECYTNPGCPGFREYGIMNPKYVGARLWAAAGVMVAVAGGSTAVAGVVTRRAKRRRMTVARAPTRFCDACRSAIPSDAALCAECGAALVAAS